MSDVVHAGLLSSRVCQEDGNGVFWLLEINGFNTSGLYAMKTEKIIKKATEIAQKC
jgi:hypothetical protein